MQNKTIANYTLKRKIGEGGMAEVWQAENKLGKQAAVKILLPALSMLPEVVARFENEAKVMVTLNHPNIRQVYDYDSIENRPCIIMEMLEGNDLSSLLKKKLTFNNEQLEKWWNQLVDALNYTHKQGVVHRDIKPSNIFLCTDGNIKLLDFGISKIRDSVTITQTGTRMGTLMYMSPEQVKDSKHLDYRSEIYSLAVTFYHLLTGAEPYDNTKSSEFEILTKIVTEPLHLDLLSEEWRNFLLPYLNKEVTDRPKLVNFEAKAESKAETKTPKSQPGKTQLIQKPKTEPATTIKQETKQEIKQEPKPNIITAPAAKKTILPWVITGAVAVLALALFIVFTTGQPKPAEPATKADVTPESLTNFTETVNGVSFKMVAIKGGTFTMGSPTSEPERTGNETQQSGTLSSFYMGVTEVTQALWQAVMGNNPSCFQADNLPVENVSWNDCQKFISKLNQLTGKSYRLPTEAEWEYACRAGTSTPFSTGENLTTSQANYDGNYPYNGNAKGQYLKKTRPVGSFTPNAWGLYDMHGNVSEWCSDWSGDYSTSAQTNPQGATSGSYRVIRGGNWRDGAPSCRVAVRHNATAALQYTSSSIWVSDLSPPSKQWEILSFLLS
jgi:formylglycine-generating enzyme required for sulfatase activity